MFDNLRFAAAERAQATEDWKARMAALERARDPFDPAVVGKLPRITCKQCSEAHGRVCEKHSKQDCRGCGNWLTTAHTHLDYVGHAEVTDRLLSIDPEWSWEPVAYDDAGLPLIRKGASGELTLWIRLTVQGVTRLGCGTVTGGFDAEKQLIGDALRNAAMRFGVALGLWSKAELESALDDNPPAAPAPTAPRAAATVSERLTELGGDWREQFGRWLVAEKIPTKPAEWSAENVAMIEAWLTRAEKGEIRPPAPNPAPEPTASPEPPSTPQSAEPDAVTQPTLVAEEPPCAEDAYEARVAATQAHVAGLDRAQVLAALVAYGLDAPRRQEEQRQMLVDALVTDESWQP